MRELKRLLKSFSYAWAGIVDVFKNENNMKIHCTIAIIALLAGLSFNISKIEWLILLITIGIVFCLEIINTAIERLVDLASPQYHPLAKAAKDMAAGAVFVFAIFSVIIGAIIFLPYLFS